MLPAIIPFYQGRAQLDRCLEHLAGQTIEVTPFVRDNNIDNVYFTAAVNEGIIEFLDQDCEFLLVLNQDMYLEPNAIETLLLFMHAHPKCGIATPLQLDPARPDYVIMGGTLEAFPWGRHRHGPLAEFVEPTQSHWANGACMLLRKQMVREIGLLDPKLRLIGSDSDYSFTARNRGWEIWVVPSARGVHEHGVSAGTRHLELEIIKLDDMIYFCRKWLTGDLYRSLSFEGAALGQKRARDLFAELRAQRDALLAEAKAQSS